MRDIYQYYVASMGRAFWVAEFSGELVGIVGAVASNDGKSVELQRMSVAEACRGKGIGSKLVVAVMNWAASMNMPKITLSTLTVKVAAIKLYEKHGFKQVGTKRLEKDFFRETFGVETNEVVEIVTYECDAASSPPL
mmetsp:Transcript_60144/g.130439  ORF Transcript_60144/g.130439 Transcript_60144/m.130439 type:complete len:137 (-) Transcript_60144:58-468(-)